VTAITKKRFLGAFDASGDISNAPRDEGADGARGGLADDLSGSGGHAAEGLASYRHYRDLVFTHARLAGSHAMVSSERAQRPVLFERKDGTLVTW